MNKKQESKSAKQLATIRFFSFQKDNSSYQENVTRLEIQF